MSWTALYDWWRGKNEAPMPGAMAPKTEPALRQEQFAPVEQTDRVELQRCVADDIILGNELDPAELKTLGIRVYEKTKRDFFLKTPGHFDEVSTRVLLAPRTRQFEVVLFAPESGLDDMVTPLYDRDPVSIDEYVRAVGFAAQNRVAGSTHKVTLVYS